MQVLTYLVKILLVVVLKYLQFTHLKVEQKRFAELTRSPDQITLYSLFRRKRSKMKPCFDRMCCCYHTITQRVNTALTFLCKELIMGCPSG